ncbi:MAG: putative porin [Flavisolibacter sp.]
MKTIKYLIAVLVFLFCCTASNCFAQNPNSILRSIGGRSSGQGGAGGDSLRARNKFEDSITIRYYYLDSTRAFKFDSSISDFTKYYPIPSDHVYLGNTGAATKSMLFQPDLREGWDPGFHAYDVYKWKVDQIKFFNTTRPYTELGYLLGSRAEQIIQVFHTQNIKPYWNFSLGYRLVSSPGQFRNQRSNHNNYLLTSWYQAPKKRYNNYFIVLYNRLQSEENGGIINDGFLNDPDYKGKEFQIPTKLGGSPVGTTNFFNSTIYTGHKYREFTFLMRQQYDFGKKDSLVTDSTVIPLFFPRVRFEHTLKINNSSYTYIDLPTEGNQSNLPDTGYYNHNYNALYNGMVLNDSVYLVDSWKEINNDFSIYQFPDAKNLQQFFKVGAQLQLLHGTFKYGSKSLYNVIGHGEYRIRTKNQKWDIITFGNLYLNGNNVGDYHGYVSLERLISKSIGTLQVGFENVNRSPSFIYDQRSSFYLDSTNKSFTNENTIHLFGSTIQPKLGLRLSADYFLISNYLYISEYYKLKQETSLFNILRINALKTFRISKHWNWMAELYIQQKTGPAPVNIPNLYTRNRLLYEGDLGFKNLSIAFGAEVKYNTPYKADGYSPVLGEFSLQDSVTISNNPELAVFLHFRIRGFKAYFRMENLNKMIFSHNNLAAPDYPYPGFILRFGVFWSFVN